MADLGKVCGDFFPNNWKGKKQTNKNNKAVPSKNEGKKHYQGSGMYCQSFFFVKPLNSESLFMQAKGGEGRKIFSEELSYVQVSRIILSHNEFHNEEQTLKMKWICLCAGAPSAAFRLQQDADIAYDSALKNKHLK